MEEFCSLRKKSARLAEPRRNDEQAELKEQSAGVKFTCVVRIQMRNRKANHRYLELRINSQGYSYFQL